MSQFFIFHNLSVSAEGHSSGGIKFRKDTIIDGKSRAYVKSYDIQTKWMYFLIKDDDLLKKYKNISDKLSADLKKEFDSKPAYNKNKI